MLYHVLFLGSKPLFLLHSCAVGWVKKEIRELYVERLSYGHSANPTNSSQTLNNFVFLDPQFSTTWTATMDPTRWYPPKCLARKRYPKQTGGVYEVHVRGKATSTGTFASIRMEMGAWTSGWMGLGWLYMNILFENIVKTSDSRTAAAPTMPMMTPYVQYRSRKHARGLLTKHLIRERSM